MPMDYTQHRRHRRATVPQSEPLPNRGQVPNSAGGHAWAVDQWKQLVRFLILGTQRGTYYIGEQDLTKQNVDAVEACIRDDPARVLCSIAAVTEKGLAASHDARLYALALLSAQTTDSAVKQALVATFPLFCNTAQQLFTFVKFSRSLRGDGRSFRRQLASWYRQPVDKLAYQFLKYPARDGFTHRDLLRLAHLKGADTEHAELFRFARALADNTLVEREDAWSDVPMALMVGTRMRLNNSQGATTDDLDLISRLRLPRETLPTTWLNDPRVWRALFEQMPTTALVRNLGNLSKHGVLVPFAPEVDRVCDRLRNTETIRLSKLHPLQLLAASYTYAKGSGVRGAGAWTPVAQIVDALQDAFHLGFQNVVPSGQRILVAVDVSGSMWSTYGVTHAYVHRVGEHHELDVPSVLQDHGNLTLMNGMPYLTAAQGAAVMALVIATTEPRTQVVAFDTEVMTDYQITARSTLRDALNYGYMGPRGTDCAAPIHWALSKQIAVDAFVILTDNETWAGQEHPAAAVERYRQQMNLPETRLAVVAMAANQFTIAAPDDARSMDFIGFDPSAPATLSAFLRGTI